MTAFVALLRAVNVGGTGKLPMRDLTEMCEAAGFGAVRTYIASGNAVFESDASEAEVKEALGARLRAYVGTPMDVFVRTADELATVLADNPFPEAAPSRTVAIFLDKPPAPGFLAGVVGREREEIRLGVREVYVHYPDGMARSKLRMPLAREGTARNMNTVAKLASMAARRL
jgi:uncharacterized protein (DUF1697 family)